MLIAGLYRVVVVFLYVCGQSMIVGVIFIPVGLVGDPVIPRAVFTILSLSWPLAVNVYCYALLAILEATEVQVALTRIQVRETDS